ncbi:MAG: hypothetical protein EBW84_08670, partial [Betaproteobacteria bacterium]|nr:hypothetical protein [Betaproteobacteria bacterium]
EEEHQRLKDLVRTLQVQAASSAANQSRGQEISPTGAVTDPTTLADNQVLTGTGQTTPVDRSFNDVGWTLGANYQLNPGSGYFARLTNTFKLPSAGEYNGNPTRTDQYVIPVKMAELGFKYVDRQVSAFVTSYFSRFEGVTFTDNIFNPATNSFTQQFARANTETLGLEAELNYRFSFLFMTDP